MTDSHRSHTASEIAAQPDCWRRAAAVAADVAEKLPREGERLAVVGCGTSWFVAQSYAAAREAAGEGDTDAFAASEFPLGRNYDRVLAITRSGTTTEVLDVLRAVRGGPRSCAITGDPDTPVREAADDVVALPFADERSVVQTRFPTTVLALLRTRLGDDVSAAIDDAVSALSAPLPAAASSAEQFTFLGHGWTYGLALEAALKMREAAGAWTEAYPAMEYRHGPMAIAAPGRVVWPLSAAPEGLAAEIEALGGHVVAPGFDPLAELVMVQRLAVRLAEDAGRDPDSPPHLTRSIVLP